MEKASRKKCGGGKLDSYRGTSLEEMDETEGKLIVAKRRFYI